MSQKEKIKEEKGNPSEHIKFFKQRKVSVLKGILIICCIISVVIFISNILIILLNAFNKEFQLSYEQTFLNDALAILGLIVTIWAGLNIYNIIERRDFEELKHSSKEITNEIKEHKNDLEAFGNDIAEMIRNKDSILLSIEYQFRNELLKEKKDPLSLFFHIKSESILCNTNHISKLLIIEQSFNIVYNLHITLQKDIKELIDSADYAQEIIKEIINDIQDEETESIKYVLLYLQVRDAQFSFYKGYAYTKLEDIYSCFNNAADKFLSISEIDEDIRIIKDDEIVYHPEIIYDPESAHFVDFGLNENLRKNSRYIAHFIGEAYSRIVLSYTDRKKVDKDSYTSLKNMISKAIFYCELSANWLKEKERYEVYHRNLGCAYERQDRLDAALKNLPFVDTNHERIIREYKQAFFDCVNDTESFDDSEKKVYHVLLSYLYKYLLINGILQNGEIVKFDDFIKNKDYSGISVDEVSIKYLKDLLEYSEYAISHSIQNSLPIVMNGFAYIFVVVLKTGNCSDVDTICQLSVRECMDRIKNRKSMLEFINHKDDYYITLDERYKKIKNYVEGLQK